MDKKMNDALDKIFKDKDAQKVLFEILNSKGLTAEELSIKTGVPIIKVEKFVQILNDGNILENLRGSQEDIDKTHDKFVKLVEKFESIYNKQLSSDEKIREYYLAISYHYVSVQNHITLIIGKEKFKEFHKDSLELAQEMFYSQIDKSDDLKKD